MLLLPGSAPSSACTHPLLGMLGPRSSAVRIGLAIMARNLAHLSRVSSPARPFFSIPELLLRLATHPPLIELKHPPVASLVTIVVVDASSLSRARVGWDGLGFRG